MRRVPVLALLLANFAIAQEAGAQTATDLAGKIAPVVIEAPTTPPAEGGLHFYSDKPTAPVLPPATMFPILPFGAPPDAPPQHLPVASNHDLGGDHAGITRAVVAIHDVSRDINETLGLLTALAGSRNTSTIILAPQFLLQSDIAGLAKQLPDQGQDLARWPLDGWIYGGDTVALAPQRGVSSFTAIDLLLLYLGDKETFPDLREIVIAGNGAGGDFTLRYAAAGQAPDLLDKDRLSVRYLVANAASYIYLTQVRPVSGKPGFTMPDASKCAGYDSYPYGINNLNDYVKRVGGNAIRARFASRYVTYLVGEKIASDDHFPDTSCGALYEGPDRLMRALNFDYYLRSNFGEDAAKTQHFLTVPTANYEAGTLFSSRCGMAVLFGNGTCDTGSANGAETR